MDSKSSSGAVIRPVGLTEQFSTVRHDLGLYRCVQNTARYSIDHSTNDLITILENALARVISRHPALCCGIINEDKDDPVFVRLESIDVSKCINHQVLDSLTPEEYEEGLIKILEHQHSQIWPNIHCQPLWKLIVVQNKATSSERTTFDAIFAWHHAIADGLSGMVFHRSFQEALNDPATVAIADHTISVPNTISLFPPQENLIKFKISWLFLLAAVWHTMRPKWLFPDSSPPWTAADVAPNAENYEANIKLISIPSEDVVGILSACREQKTTLTGLFQALVTASLAHRVPHATSFTSSTPFSPRSVSGISSTDAIAVQVCSHSFKYTPDIVSAIRASSNPQKETHQIWEVARTFRNSLAADMARMPTDNVAGLLPYAGSIHKMFLSKLGKPRDDTFQVSNIGAFKNAVGVGQWRIERMFFTQCGMAGSAFTFNATSVVGGPLSVSVTWMGGDIEEPLVANIVADIQYALKCIAGGREVSLGHLD
ncbi:Alcohol acetyltransferase [Hyaloscypha variabilis]